MKISVVIPAFNEEKLLPATIQAVRGAAEVFIERGWDWELVVCDNNSKDRTAEVARAQGARVVFEPVNQIARARNTGAAAATGDWLVFVDADSRPSRELFDDMAGMLVLGKYVGGGATVKMDAHKFHAAAWLANHLWNGISRVRRWMAGSFIFCEAMAFRSLGGFSQELFVSEEIEFSQRLKRYAAGQGKQVVILHRHPLMTSARKLALYSRQEFLTFVFKGVWSRGARFKQRDHCHIWYDGRR